MVDVVRLFEMLNLGRSYTQIAVELGISRSTVCWYRKRGGHAALPTPRYDWIEVRKYYDSGHSRLETIEKFGFAKATWDKARRRGRIIIRPNREPLATLLTEASAASRGTVKARLIDEGVLDNKCEECGQLPLWNGKPLVLVLDHENGINNDYRKENLRLLCPNCNSQTETFAGRNTLRSRLKAGRQALTLDMGVRVPPSEQRSGVD